MEGLMTYEDYQLLLKGDLGKYYEGRWEYFKEVIDIIKSEKVESVLEIGPAQEPIVKNCDVMIKPEDDMWDCPKDSRNYPAHHMLDEELIGDWTLNIKPEKIIKIPRTGPEVSKGPRIIYFWKF